MEKNSWSNMQINAYSPIYKIYTYIATIFFCSVLISVMLHFTYFFPLTNQAIILYLSIISLEEEVEHLSKNQKTGEALATHLCFYR